MPSNVLAIWFGNFLCSWIHFERESNLYGRRCVMLVALVALIAICMVAFINTSLHSWRTRDRENATMNCKMLLVDCKTLTGAHLVKNIDHPHFDGSMAYGRTDRPTDRFRFKNKETGWNNSWKKIYKKNGERANENEIHSKNKRARDDFSAKILSVRSEIAILQSKRWRSRH